MRAFRGTPVEGWKIITGLDKGGFENDINRLMDDYTFVDFQFGTCVRPSGDVQYSAAILLAKKT